MRPWKCCLAAGALLAATSLVEIPHSARAADHRDAPAINEDVRADINDVYAFVNPNNGNTVLALTINPLVAPGSPGVAFSPNVLYEIKIDNTGDAREDRVIQARFSDGTANQNVTVNLFQTATITTPSGSRRPFLGVTPPAAPAPTATATGPGNGTVFSGGGMRVFAGLRDDPFFFDLVFVFRVLGFLPGGPPPRSPGVDFFQGLNVSILAVEVPPALLRGATGNTIRVWATTNRNGPADRMGLPVINTVLIPSSRKDEFNRSAPADDRALFRADALASLIRINNNATYSAGVVDAVLPDVLTLDTASTSGFLNGRRPQDDVIDAVLALASNNAVTGDAVNANDVPFLTDFPFFAPPHQPSEALPPRG